MSITVDSLLSRPKLDCDVGYDIAVKGTSVAVKGGLSPSPLTVARRCDSLRAAGRHEVTNEGK